jgi:uncharacterized membrane protein YedE/YeeE
MTHDSGDATDAGRLHEDLSRDEAIVGASDRGFGLTLAGFCGLVGTVRLALGYDGTEWWLGAALVALMVALLWPVLLGPANRLWLRLGLLLYKIVNPAVMALIFVTTVVPIGLVLRALGKDPLRLRRDPNAASYWIVREPPGIAPETMKNQF